MWIGSAGWAPNDAARKWLQDDIWPAITTRVPEARLHLFGAAAGTSRADGRDAGRRSIVWRDAPRESAEAFLPHGILLIPMRAAAGVRMRVLEAWARGVPVIASPAAVAGLDTEDGRDVLIAADARAFANAAARLITEPSLRARLVHEGRATLARRHDPGKLAEATLDVYRLAMAHNRTRSQHPSAESESGSKPNVRAREVGKSQKRR
jgi:glycosyltransferase involved in cell wall biosynthesis